MGLPADLVSLPTSPWDERPTELPLDVEECRTAIWMARGNITKAAEIMKVTSQRLRRFVDASPRLSAETLEAKEGLVDRAEEVVHDALNDVNDPGRQDSMARFVLASQGRKRGWGNGAGGVKVINPTGPINISWGDGSQISGPQPGDDAKVIDQ
jgi:hypothetical protein